MPRGAHNKGTGRMAMHRDEAHPFLAWGHWWRSREDFEVYREEEHFRARARRQGYLDNYEEFRQLEKRAGDALNALKRREKWIKREMVRLREKHGLHSHANRTHLRAAGERTKDPEVFALLNLMSYASLNDTERIAQIRKLFLEGKPPAEILYQTALMVGVNLRKRS